jgi:hypothetical protein
MADTVEIPEDLQGRGFTPDQIKMISRVRLELGALVVKLCNEEDFLSTTDVLVVLEGAVEKFKQLQRDQMTPLP